MHLDSTARMKTLCIVAFFASVVFGEVIRTIPSNDDIIPGEFLVGLNTDLVRTKSQEDALVETLKSYNVETVKFWHMGSLKMLYVKGDEADVMQVGKMAEVRYTEPNGWAYAAQCSEGSAAGCWGLDRVDQRDQLGYSSPSEPSAVYNWGESDGAGIKAYIGDTGIDVDHPDFGGRGTYGYNAIDVGEDPNDVNGHGSHCAGTIGSNSYGVAKAAELVGVKVLSDFGSGPWSAIIDGMAWIETDAAGQGVTSFSLSGSCCNQAVEDAVNALIGSGVTVVASAGNSDRDACLETPANIPDVITVGASAVDDQTATFSNYGPCVDIYGPGVDVLSCAPGGGTAIMSGTSMSCPHVAGVVARYLSSNPSATPADVDAWLKANGTPDALTFQPGQDADNLLAYAPCPLP